VHVSLGFVGIQIEGKEYFMKHRSRQRERRPKLLFGQRNIVTQPIAAQRELETVSVFESLLRKFGIIDRDANLTKHAAYSEFAKVERDPVVSRIREKLWKEGKLRKGSGLFSNVAETSQCLELMSSDALLRLRARMILQDFRVTHPDDKGEKETRA
jgi:hypothetical protein